jgi:chemotaxis protein methyltransferase CheR
MVYDPTIYKKKLTQEEFIRLSRFIHENVGIKMPPAKRLMLEGRLRKRIKFLGMKSFTEYIDYLFSDKGMEEEVLHMIDVVTTNKTDFFREPNHFDYLIQKALPQLITAHGAGIRRQLMVWSAGCSTGEEPYSLAMAMHEFGKKYPGFMFDYRILATDISTRVLEMAKRAVYAEERVQPIPENMKKKYVMRSKDSRRKLIRIIPGLREAVRFRRLNLLDDDFGFRERMDIVFFRNVLIYFEKPTQEMILKKVVKYLKSDGYLFIGHSETLLEMDLPLRAVNPTVYKRILE